MMTSRQIRRTQRLLLLVTTGLALSYAAIYRPLEERSHSLDAPLQQAWKKLNATEVNAQSDDPIDLRKIEERLRQKQKALGKLQQAERTVSNQLALDSATRTKIGEAFQLVDFQIEEQSRIEDLIRNAEQNHVALNPSLVLGFPEYTADKTQPELLWAQLFFLDHLLSAAVQSKVSLIQEIELPPMAGHQLSTNSAPFLYEVPVRIEVVGPMESISRLLASLPLREEAAKAQHLRPEKPPLYVHRFILKKNSPEKPDEARLDLRASGFVLPN